MDIIKRIHWPGVVGFATTAFGVLSSPLVTSVLSPHVALTITGVGAGIQAFTKAVHSKGVDNS